MAVGDCGKRVSDAVAKTVEGGGDVVEATAEAARSGIVSGLRGAKQLRGR